MYDLIISSAILVDPCSSLTCENGGTCVFANGTASCNCQLGFTGANCSISKYFL